MWNSCQVCFPSVISFHDNHPFRTVFICKILSFITCIIKFMISLTTYFDTFEKYYFHIFPFSLFGSNFPFKMCMRTSVLHTRRILNACNECIAFYYVYSNWYICHGNRYVSLTFGTNRTVLPCIIIFLPKR